MPEGDTLRAAADRLGPLLRGRTLQRFWAKKLAGHRPTAGQTIEDVRAVGKHLLIDFDRDLTLRTHLGMTGSWRPVTAERADVARLGPQLRVLIVVDGGGAACFAAPTVTTFLRSGDDDPVEHLGPDLSDAELDLVGIEARVASLAGDSTLLVDLLLDQRIAAGVGNVYKSEVLFRCGHPPDARVGDLDHERLAQLFVVAHDLLRRNVARPETRRETAPGGGYFVYGRNRQPCLRCGTPVRRTVNGRTARSTYWCPTCQPVRPGASSTWSVS